MRGPSKADLERQVQDLQEQLSKRANLSVEDHTHLKDELRTTQEALAEAEALLAAAQEATVVVEAARAALQEQIAQAVPAATTGAASQGPVPLGDQVNVLIPRPTGSGWSIRESMQVTKPEYAEIQRTVRSLVIRATLDWTEDFRRQDPEKLATLFKAARLAHPILCHYANNWATAAIACQYMQNKRKHAYKQGYISKRRAHHVSGQENLPANNAM